MAILHSMKRPIFVRPLTDAERESLEAGLRSPDAFTLRRCQILLASERGKNAYQIAHELGCNPQTARNAIHAFNEKGLPEALQPGSKHPHTVHRAFDPEQAEALRELLHQRPRKFGKDTSRKTKEKKAARPIDPPRRRPPRLGGGFPGRDLVETAGATSSQQLKRCRRAPALGRTVGC